MEVRPMRKLKSHESVANFNFHPHFSEDTLNGLYFNNTYLPEEIVITILSKISPTELLNASQVCRKWCNLIKTTVFWTDLYLSKTGKKPKKLPWYVYYCYFTSGCFDRNLLRNNGGQLGFKYWSFKNNFYSDRFQVEKKPIGAGPVPLDYPDFDGFTCCFVPSCNNCNKSQVICFENKKLMQFILVKYNPHIYMSEWVATSFDCGGIYQVWCKLLGADEYVLKKQEEYLKADSDWCKKELLVKCYPQGVVGIVFQHESKETRAGHGCKMAGGVVKILFDSMEPLPEECELKH